MSAYGWFTAFVVTVIGLMAVQIVWDLAVGWFCDGSEVCDRLLSDEWGQR